MDLASLAVFRAVAREQSVTRAAELLGRVPSNVTTRIQQLEAEIGVTLFHRDRKRMALTAEGRTYLDYADRILNLADEAQQTVNPARPFGALRVGSMESTAASRLPQPLARFNARWPEVTIDLSTGPTRQLIEALLAHRIDCALIAIPPGRCWLDPDALEQAAIYREELVLLLPPGHPEAQRSDEIRPRSLAAFGQGCAYRFLAEEWITGFGARPAQLRVHEVRSYHAMVACTAAGASFCVLPRSVLDLVPDAGRFTVQPLMTVDTSLAVRAGFSTPAFMELREALLESSDISSARTSENVGSAS